MDDKFLPKITFPEFQDIRVQEAIKEVENQGLIEAIYPTDECNTLGCPDKGKLELYNSAITQIEDNHADAMIAGACYPKKIIINEIIGHKKTKLAGRLFTIAPLKLDIFPNKYIYMLDPIIKMKKTAFSLRGVVKSAISTFESIEGRAPRVALITNNEYEEDSEEIFREFNSKFGDEFREYLYPSPVQLDVALDSKIRLYKLNVSMEDADILVFDDLTCANVFYKSVALQRNSTCGTLMRGMSKGIYGLVSRGADKDELVRLIKIIAENCKALKE
ncbi:phosphate acyltransferase [Vibrio rotiferianus]|uniref:phosphate acyltransferase n=1 Tax=Vibrio rotiferianus TaxID=190895 RepID=UPI003909E118